MIFPNNDAIGEFTIVGYGTWYEYRISKGDAPMQGTWGIDNGFKHEIMVCDGSVRFCNIKKTVAYIAVGEDEYGKPIVEKWKIKHNWMK